MLTKDDLLAIGNLIDEKIKPLKQGQQVLEAGIERIEQKLDREVTDLAETQREIVIKLDKLEDHETRITQLEADSELPKHH